MRSFSEIDTTSKRASKAAGYSWGISEEIGKAIRSLELFGLPGITNLNLYLTNTHALGNILYTDYIHLFQVSGIILLVAMIGAITLTFNKRENIKRQSYFEQIEREKATAVSLVDVKSGEGVKLDD